MLSRVNLGLNTNLSSLETQKIVLCKWQISFEVVSKISFLSYLDIFEKIEKIFKLFRLFMFLGKLKRIRPLTLQLTLSPTSPLCRDSWIASTTAPLHASHRAGARSCCFQFLLVSCLLWVPAIQLERLWFLLTWHIFSVTSWVKVVKTICRQRNDNFINFIYKTRWWY